MICHAMKFCTTYEITMNITCVEYSLRKLHELLVTLINVHHAVLLSNQSVIATVKVKVKVLVVLVE